jgi:hypothetical protein
MADSHTSMYKDKNGVSWVVSGTSAGNWFGSPSASSVIHYEPEPPDTEVFKDGSPADPFGMQAVVKQAIDKYAAAHKKDVVLTVSSSADRGVLILVLVAAAIWLSE